MLPGAAPLLPRTPPLRACAVCLPGSVPSRAPRRGAVPLLRKLVTSKCRAVPNPASRCQPHVRPRQHVADCAWPSRARRALCIEKIFQKNCTGRADGQGAPARAAVGRACALPAAARQRGGGGRGDGRRRRPGAAAGGPCCGERRPVGQRRRGGGRAGRSRRRGPRRSGRRRRRHAARRHGQGLHGSGGPLAL
jgi:hypothetical protein